MEERLADLQAQLAAAKAAAAACADTAGAAAQALSDELAKLKEDLAAREVHCNPASSKWDCEHC